MSSEALDDVAVRLPATAPSADAPGQHVLLKAGALQRAILNSANFSSIATDANGVIRVFSAGAERMLGYAAGEVLNTITLADISDPQALVARAQALSVELSTPITPGFEALVFKASFGIEDLYELTYIRKDGSRFPTVVSVTALRDTENAIIGYLLIGTDNTARNEAAERLRLQSAALNAAANAIAITDRAGLIQWINPAFSVLTGYSAAEAVGRNPRDLVKSGQHQQVFYENLWDTIVSGHVWRGEMVNRRKDDSLYTEEQTITPVRDVQGEISHFIAIKQDISERKCAEQQFQESEERVRQSEILNRSLVEHLPQRIFVKDLNSNYVFCNAVYAGDLGLEPAEIVGKDDFAFFSRELAEAYRADDRQVMTDGKTRALDEPYTVAGEELWIHTVKVAYRDEQGDIIGVLGLFEDITKRKQAEKQSRESEARLNEAQHMAHIGSWRFVPGGPFIGSDEMYELHKLPRGVPPIIESLTANVHPDDRMSSAAAFEAAIASDSLEFKSEYRVVWPDGQVRHMLSIASITRDSEGRLIDVVGTVQDMTDGVRAAEALRASEERMRFALEAAGVGIWDIDFTTGVLRWSGILESQYGLKPGTFGGTLEAFVERVHPLDRGSVLETMSKANRSGADFTLPHRTIWPDGTVRWLTGAGRILLGDHGEPARGVGISQDVTERRTLEEQFQQAQKMEAIGRLAGGVAHDFNNLLTAILGYCELFLLDVGQGDPRGADIMEIQKAGTRAAGLTRQLLAFSRKQIIQPALLDLNAIVAGMRGMLGRLIGEDVRVVVSLRSDLASVKADCGQVEQVIMNLAVNARDAMPKGGTLTIETANVELDEHYATTHLDVKPGPYVVLTVTDTGTGMTPEVQARLFEPFFTTKEPGKGTGLGMATVYGVVTRSGGSVGVYSEVGKGTSFKVYFPRADADEQIVETPAPVARKSVGQTVLVVEDEDGLRELAKRLLQRQGHAVLIAANAAEARRLFEENPAINLLLTDVVMPGASGPELTRQLVEQRPELKVIYMSGYTEDVIVQHGVLKPGIAFLNKPFTSQTLAAKIREVLER